MTEARAQTADALAELRALTRGIAPPILADRGLAAALTALADRSPVPTTVQLALPLRYAAPVETAAYFVASEALTNVAKHSRATSATLRAWVGDGRLAVEVVDDGVGGASLAKGHGLAGLADRVAALDGSLGVESPEGGPTTVRAVIPCGSIVADDSVLLREGLVRVLAEAGHEVVAAVGDADQLLAAAPEHSPELAVLDVRMPPTFRDEGVRAAIQLRSRAAGDGHPAAVASTSRWPTRKSCSPPARGGRLSAQGPGRRRWTSWPARCDRRIADGGTVLDPEVVGSCSPAPAHRPARRAHPARARGAPADGRGPHQRGIGAGAVHRRRGGREERRPRSSASSGSRLPASEDHRRVLAVLAWLQAT